MLKNTIRTRVISLKSFFTKLKKKKTIIGWLAERNVITHGRGGKYPVYESERTRKHEFESWTINLRLG